MIFHTSESTMYMYIQPWCVIKEETKNKLKKQILITSKQIF